MSRTFTNRAGASITVDSNGIYPMLRTDTAHGRFSVLRDEDLPAFLGAVIDRSTRLGNKIKHVVLDGKPSIKVGDGTKAGIVYKPTTDDQAERNLNFALANLAAYNYWVETGKAEEERKAKREAELKAAVDRRAKEAAEANLRRIEQEERDGLALYNKAHGRSYLSFASVPFMGSTAKQEWITLAKTKKALEREQFAASLNRGGYLTNAPVFPRVRPFGY